MINVEAHAAHCRMASAKKIKRKKKNRVEERKRVGMVDSPTPSDFCCALKKKF